MIGRRLRVLMLGATAGLLPTQLSSAQSSADSVAVMRAIGAGLRDEARQVLASDSLIVELARVAGASLVASQHEAYPRCPWGSGPPPTGAGFRVGVRAIRFTPEGDTARVVVFQRCDNPPESRRRAFARDFEYLVARQPTGGWRVLARRLTRIT